MRDVKHDGGGKEGGEEGTTLYSVYQSLFYKFILKQTTTAVYFRLVLE